MPDTIAPPAKPPGKPGLPSWVTDTPGVTTGSISSVKPEPKEPIAPAPDPAPDPKPKPDPAPAPDPKAGDDDEAWPRSAEQWKAKKAKEKEKRDAIAKERDEIKADRERLAAEIAELKKAGPSEELTKLREERDELDRQLRQSALENHPRFKQYFDGGIKAATESIKRVVGGDRATQIEAALKLPPGEYRDTQLQNLVEDLPTLKQGQVGSLLTKIGDLQAERDSELANAHANWDKIQTENTAKATAQQKAAQEAREKLVSSTITAIAGEELKGHLETQDMDLAKRIALGGTKDPADTVKLIARGVAWPKVLNALATAQAENATLKAQITKMESATPGLPGGSPRAGSDPNPKPKVNVNSPMGTAQAWVDDFSNKRR